MFLVDDDEADVGERGEDGEPRPDDDVHVARPDATPFVGPLAVAETRVDECDPSIEVGPEAIDERQRERDLRDQDEGRAARFEARRDRLDVDGRLAAAGDAVEQERARVARRDRRRGCGRPRRPGPGAGRWSAAVRRAGLRVVPRAGRRGRSRTSALGQTTPDQTRDGAASVASGQVRPERLVRPRCQPARRGRPPGADPSGRPARRPRPRRLRRSPTSVIADPALVARPRPGADERPLEADPPVRLERSQPPQEAGPAVRSGEVADGSRAALQLRRGGRARPASSGTAAAPVPGVRSATSSSRSSSPGGSIARSTSAGGAR